MKKYKDAYAVASWVAAGMKKMYCEVCDDRTSHTALRKNIRCECCGTVYTTAYRRTKTPLNTILEE